MEINVRLHTNYLTFIFSRSRLLSRNDIDSNADCCCCIFLYFSPTFLDVSVSARWHYIGIVTNTKWACFVLHTATLHAMHRENAKNCNPLASFQASSIKPKTCLCSALLPFRVRLVASTMPWLRKKTNSLVRRSISLCTFFLDAIRFVAWQNLLFVLYCGLLCYSLRFGGKLVGIFIAAPSRWLAQIVDVNKLHASFVGRTKHRKFRTQRNSVLWPVPNIVCTC